MPRISEFFGIVICMYYDDHAPPHFHARYAGQEAVIEIESLRVLAGSLSPRAQGLVVEWALLRRAELRNAWTLAEQFKPLPWVDALP